MRRIGTLLAVFGGLAVTLLAAHLAGAQSGQPRLPDLDQTAPSDVGVRVAGDRLLLGFDSAIENEGEGPLIIRGERPTANDEMVASQYVQNADGSETAHTGVGRMQYVEAGGHEHWHLLDAARYELRRPSDHALVTRDHKTGFCLGDRYDRDPDEREPFEPASVQYPFNCESNKPGATRVEEGISVGYGDDYPAFLEGQSIDVTDVAAGEYELVHRANPDGALHEMSPANNASSILLRLERPEGAAARVTVLRTCPDSEFCADPSTTGGGTTGPGGGTTTGGTTGGEPAPADRLTQRQASLYAAQAARRLGRVTGLRRACRRRTSLSFACRVAWRRGRARYRGTATIRLAPNGQRWSYRLVVRRTLRGTRSRRLVREGSRPVGRA